MQLAFGAAAAELAAFERGDAGGVIAAIFEALQRIDDERRDRPCPTIPTIPHKVASNPSPRRAYAQV